MYIQRLIAVAVVLLAAPALRAQTGNLDTKVGVISLQEAIQSTEEGKQASAELQAQFAPRESEIANLQKQIQDIGTRLQTGQTTLSDDETARLRYEGTRLEHTLQRKQQELQADSSDASQDAISQIGMKMTNLLDKYAKDRGYSVILDTSSSQTPVVYASDQADITEDIVRLYDDAYPVKTGSGQSRPPATPKGTGSKKP
jgi:outer membrane protein